MFCRLIYFFNLFATNIIPILYLFQFIKTVEVIHKTVGNGTWFFVLALLFTLVTIKRYKNILTIFLGGRLNSLILSSVQELRCFLCGSTFFKFGLLFFQNDSEWLEEESSDEESRALLQSAHHEMSWQTMDGETYQGLFPFRWDNSGVYPSTCVYDVSRHRFLL